MCTFLCVCVCLSVWCVGVCVCVCVCVCLWFGAPSCSVGASLPSTPLKSQIPGEISVPPPRPVCVCVCVSSSVSLSPGCSGLMFAPCLTEHSLKPVPAPHVCVFLYVSICVCGHYNTPCRNLFSESGCMRVCIKCAYARACVCVCVAAHFQLDLTFEFALYV